MANWSQVWQTSQPPSGSCGSCICVPTYNASCSSSTSGSILANLDTSITTVAQAMAHYGEQLRRRRGAQYCYTRFESSAYIWEMPDALVTVGGGGQYPMSITYVHGPDSGSASFSDIDQAIAWLAHRL